MNVYTPMMTGPIRLLPVDLYEAQQAQTTTYVPPSMIKQQPTPVPPPPVIGYSVFTQQGQPTGEVAPIGPSLFDKILLLPAAGTESRLQTEGKTLFTTQEPKAEPEVPWYTKMVEFERKQAMPVNVGGVTISGRSAGTWMSTVFAFGGGPIVSSVASSWLGRMAAWGALGGLFGGTEAAIRGEDVPKSIFAGAVAAGAFSLGAEFIISLKSTSFIKGLAEAVSPSKATRYLAMSRSMEGLAGSELDIQIEKSQLKAMPSKWKTPYGPLGEADNPLNLPHFDYIYEKAETTPKLEKGFMGGGAAVERRWASGGLSYSKVIEDLTSPEAFIKPASDKMPDLVYANAFHPPRIGVSYPSIGLFLPSGIAQTAYERTTLKPIAEEGTGLMSFQRNLTITMPVSRMREDIFAVPAVALEMRSDLMPRQLTEELQVQRQAMRQTSILSLESFVVPKEAEVARWRPSKRWEDFEMILPLKGRKGGSYEERKNPFNIKFLKDIGKIDRRWT
jgi:hypothetical protein